MSLFPLKPTHKPVKTYFEALATFQKHGHTTEGNTRSAFADLLKRCCHPYGWHLVEEYPFKGTNEDDLTKEGKAKREKGYPLTKSLSRHPATLSFHTGEVISTRSSWQRNTHRC